MHGEAYGQRKKWLIGALDGALEMGKGSDLEG